MSRHVIATEGVPTVLPATRLKPGALYMDSDRIPVTDNFNLQNPAIGWATDLRRDDKNQISVEITLLEEREIDEERYDFSFWATNLMEETVDATDGDEEYRLILKARVQGIAIVPKSY